MGCTSLDNSVNGRGPGIMGGLEMFESIIHWELEY